MSLIIIGKGGHSKVVFDALQKGETVQRIVFMDEVDGLKPHPNQEAFIAIGDNTARERISKLDFLFINVIHPTACFWKLDCIGSYFGANSIVGPDSKVGNFCIINTAVVLEHSSTVGDFAHLAPGVVTGGRVRIGSRTFIGLNSTIKDGVTVGNNCIVGMSSNVICDIPDNTVWFGNPAKLQKEIK